MHFCKTPIFLPLLCSLVLTTSSWAKDHEPEQFITLRGDQISGILGVSRVPHAMKSLERFGAPAEYVNDDLEKLKVNEGPCIYVAGLSNLGPGTTYGVVIECFDLVTERETKTFAYSTDAAGKVVTGGKLSPVGDYGKGDVLFDLPAWKWVSEHVSSELERKIATDRAQLPSVASQTVYKANPTNQQSGPIVTAPVLYRTTDAVFSDSAIRANISGLSIISLVIDTHGLPQQVRTVLPVGYGVDEEAVRAVELYRFHPSKLEGKPVPVRITIEVNFRR